MLASIAFSTQASALEQPCEIPAAATSNVRQKCEHEMCDSQRSFQLLDLPQGKFHLIVRLLDSLGVVVPCHFVRERCILAELAIPIDRRLPVERSVRLDSPVHGCARVGGYGVVCTASYPPARSSVRACRLTRRSATRTFRRAIAWTPSKGLAPFSPMRPIQSTTGLH
jgi:hypothetical protein